MSIQPCNETPDELEMLAEGLAQDIDIYNAPPEFDVSIQNDETLANALAVALRHIARLERFLSLTDATRELLSGIDIVWLNAHEQLKLNKKNN